MIPHLWSFLRRKIRPGADVGWTLSRPTTVLGVEFGDCSGRLANSSLAQQSARVLGLGPWLALIPKGADLHPSAAEVMGLLDDELRSTDVLTVDHLLAGPHQKPVWIAKGLLGETAFRDPWHPVYRAPIFVRRDGLGQAKAAEDEIVQRRQQLRDACAGKTLSYAHVAIPLIVQADHKVELSVNSRVDFDSECAVSVVVLTCGSPTLGACLRGLLAEARRGVRLELILVVNGAAAETGLGEECLDALHELRGTSIITVQNCTEPFNYARMTNEAVKSATYGTLLFLNDDVVPTEPGWIGGLFQSLSETKDKCAVGPVLTFANGVIQHAGVAMGFADCVGHPLAYAPMKSLNYFTWGGAYEVSALTGACLMVAVATFQSLGGFDEGFAASYNDVDFCLRLRSEQGRCIVCSTVVLHHYESVSRGYDRVGKKLKRRLGERAHLLDKWGEKVLQEELYFSPWLSRKTSIPFIDRKISENPRALVLRNRNGVLERQAQL